MQPFLALPVPAYYTIDSSGVICPLVIIIVSYNVFLMYKWDCHMSVQIRHCGVCSSGRRGSISALSKVYDAGRLYLQRASRHQLIIRVGMSKHFLIREI